MFLSNIRLDRTEGQKRPKIREEQSQEDKKRLSQLVCHVCLCRDGKSGWWYILWWCGGGGVTSVITIPGGSETKIVWLFQDWYRSWFCLSKWPVYKGEKLLAPCPAECSQVQSSCPFLTIFEEASMAAGDPTFLCQGEMEDWLCCSVVLWLIVITRCELSSDSMLSSPPTSHLQHNAGPAASSIHNKYSLRQNVNFERGLCSFVNRPTLPPLPSPHLTLSQRNELQYADTDFYWFQLRGNRDRRGEERRGGREWLLSKQYRVLVSPAQPSQSLNKRNSMSSL